MFLHIFPTTKDSTKYMSKCTLQKCTSVSLIFWFLFTNLFIRHNLEMMVDQLICPLCVEVSLVAKPTFFYWNLRWKLSPSYLCIHAWAFENLQNWRATHSKLLVEILAKIKQGIKRYSPFFFQKNFAKFSFCNKKKLLCFYTLFKQVSRI
jgi:hypothetical protein